MAHKKGASSSKNGRDSESKRLGAKRADGQFVLAGNIIYRQRGTKIHPGTNVGLGKDDTLYSKIDGVLKLEGISSTNAGKNKKIIAMDGQLVSGFGPRVGEAAVQLNQLLHQ